MPSDLSAGQAALLGLIHGPAELLPVSSSAHVALVPQIAGWPYAALPGDVRKAFEVALHTGTLAGLVWLVPRPPARRALLATLPAAVVGFTLERPIEQRLGGVRATAAGLLAGSVLLLIADARGPGGGGGAAGAAADRAAGRAADDAGDRDAIVLGLAQALALWPGVSRLGMTVAAARLLGFERGAAFALGREVGLPVVAGATGLKGWRLARGGLPRELRVPFAAGAVAAAAATLAAAPLRRATAIAPLAAERAALAVAALARLRRSRP
jgi:undecaprenyl-diphosphatase